MPLICATLPARPLMLGAGSPAGPLHELRDGVQSSSITMQVGTDAGAVTEYIAMYGCKGCGSNLSRTRSAPVIWKRVESNRTQMIEGEIGS